VKGREKGETGFSHASQVVSVFSELGFHDSPCPQISSDTLDEHNVLLF
jgi:hypothetical protein